MSCVTFQINLQACCPSQETYEKVEMNFSCDIDLTIAPYNDMVIVWTGNSSTPIARRGIKSCYTILGVSPTSYNSNAWSVDNNFMFSGINQCTSCATVYPCSNVDDLTCKPCVGITPYPYNQNVLTNVCQPSSCWNWDNPITLLQNEYNINVSSIALNVGTNTGDIDFTFNAGWRPNRFQIWWDYDGSLGGQAGMTKVCDSLFVGNGLRFFRNDVKNFWSNFTNRNPIGENVHFNCLYTCNGTNTWVSPLITIHPPNNRRFCYYSGFTSSEINTGPFLALTTVDRDNDWGVQYPQGNFPWNIPVPTYGSPGQIGVVNNYPDSGDPSSSGLIKLRFYKPFPTPSVVYIVSYRGFIPSQTVFADEAELLQVDGACN